MSIYMKLDGIKGNVTTKGYEGTIELRQGGVNYSRNVQTKVGNASNRQVGAAQISTFHIEKVADASSSKLTARMLTGQVIPSAQIFMCNSEKEASQPHVTYTLSNVVIKNINNTLTAGSTLPLEDLELDFTKIEVCFNPTDALNKMGAREVIAYDLEKATIV